MTRSPYLIAYQVYFVCLEVFGAFQGLFQLMEAWMAIGRNCVSLRNIPNELLVTQSDFGRPQRSPRVKRRHSNYPSIGIFIPCFNEDTHLVRKTILGVLNLDYPKELLSVYLCDDGRDESKRDMMEELGQQRRGYDLHWVVRPDEKHAKAGNLNHCIAKSRTTLIMSLDADFVPRRNFLQRLVPYFYNLNEGTGRYEFNEDLAAVQTPQHFRNLSPYDSDPLDQRSTFFFDYIMPSKDYFNAAPIIGTNNLLNRRVLGDVGYYPHVSVTEDSALSISLHKRGFRTYYVRESLATGLATEAMWSNLRQRARWLMGDFQLLFALRDGPFCKGLKWSQRMFYIQMSYHRMMTIQHILLEVGIVLFLVFSVSPLDAADPIKFTVYFLVHVATQVLRATALTWSSQGLSKSEAGSTIFATIFEYHTLKGLLVTMFKRNIKFSVTDKRAGRAPRTGGGANLDGAPEDESFSGVDSSAAFRSTKHAAAFEDDNQEWTTFRDGQLADVASESVLKFPHLSPQRTRAQRTDNSHERRRNTSYVWYNAVLFCLFLFSVVWSLIKQPELIGYKRRVRVGRRTYEVRNTSALPYALGIGFALMEMIPHGLAVLVAMYFVPYLRQSKGMETDLDHGRCDQYAVHPQTGKLFVPWSFVSLFPIVRLLLLIGASAAQFIFVWGPYKTDLLVPLRG